MTRTHSIESCHAGMSGTQPGITRIQARRTGIRHTGMTEIRHAGMSGNFGRWRVAPNSPVLPTGSATSHALP